MGETTNSRPLLREEEELTVQNPITPEAAQHRMFEFLETIPTETYVYATVGSIIASAFMFLTGRRHLALFIGEWPMTFLALGLLYKLMRPSGENIPERVGAAFERVTR